MLKVFVLLSALVEPIPANPFISYLGPAINFSEGWPVVLPVPAIIIEEVDPISTRPAPTMED